MADQPQPAASEQPILNTRDAATVIEASMGDILPEYNDAAEEKPRKEEPKDEPELALSDDDAEELEATASDEEGVEEDVSDEDTPDTDPDGDDDGEPIQTLQDMAEALEIPFAEFLDNFTIPIKVDGETTQITLAEAQKGHQLEAVFTRNSQALAQERSQFDEQRQSAISQHQQGMQKLANDTAAMRNFIMQDYNTPAMAQLRIDNPAEWNARLTEGQQRLTAIDNVAQQLNQQQLAQNQQQQQQTSQQFDGYMESQRGSLSAGLSERKVEMDDAKLGDVKTFLQDKYGYTPEELTHTYDHRMVLMALDAMSAREAVSKESVAKKKFAKLPRMQKPGTIKKPGSATRRKVANLQERAKKSGTRQDAAKAIEALL